MLCTEKGKPVHDSSETDTTVQMGNSSIENLSSAALDFLPSNVCEIPSRQVVDCKIETQEGLKVNSLPFILF